MSRFIVQLRNLTLICLVSFMALFVQPSSAEANQVEKDVSTSRPAQTYQLDAEVTSIDFNYVYRGARGMRVHITVWADGYKGRCLNAGIFFYWSNRSALAASRSAPSRNKTRAGQLTSSQRLNPAYDSTVWDELVYFIPNSYLPRVNSTQKAYVKAAVGVCGTGTLDLKGTGQAFVINP